MTNAAGEVKTLVQARSLLASAIDTVTIGSIQLKPNEGNIGETYYFDPASKTAWNSRGLPNPGIEETLPWLSGFRKECHAVDKQVCLSIAASSPEDYGRLARIAASSVDCIEVNAGCPNVWGPGGRKPIASYNPDLLEEILREIGGQIPQGTRVLVKVSPIEDALIPHIARVINGHDFVHGVIATNTLKDQQSKRADGSEALAFRAHEGAELMHVGGMSGRGLKTESLRCVRGLRTHLEPGIRITGCGGIFTGSDAREYLEAGADDLSIGTAFFEQGPKVFSDVFEELVILDEAV